MKKYFRIRSYTKIEKRKLKREHLGLIIIASFLSANVYMGFCRDDINDNFNGLYVMNQDLLKRVEIAKTEYGSTVSLVEIVEKAKELGYNEAAEVFYVQKPSSYAKLP